MFDVWCAETTFADGYVDLLHEPREHVRFARQMVYHCAKRDRSGISAGE